MTVKIELLGEINFYQAIIIQIVAAILAGGIIGFERELKMKSAGLKTNILICLGATLYTAMSLVSLGEHTTMADPNRMAAQVVSGIGFLGAGAIIQARGQIMGLTTAATIWLVAAVGVAIGLGYPLTGLCFVIFTLVILRLLGPLYRLVTVSHSYIMEIISYGSVKSNIDIILNEKREKLIDSFEKIVNDKEGLYLLHLELTTDPKRLSALMRDFKSVAQVKSVTFQKLRQHSNLLDDYENHLEEEK